jgi:hypothetical protein
MNVSEPEHYTKGSIECIDYIKDVLTAEEYQGYLRGNITKYLHRFRDKNGLEDLKKALVYLGWLIEEVGDVSKFDEYGNYGENNGVLTEK